MGRNRAVTIEKRIPTMMIKSGTLVLVADGRKFMLLRDVGSATDPALAMLAEEEADNPSTHEQGTDRPGRTHSSMGSRRSSYGDTDWQRSEEHTSELQ